jgi:hypothetical protein
MEDKNRANFAEVRHVSSFDDWFAKNGRPTLYNNPQYLMQSNFEQSKKFVCSYGVDSKTGTRICC